MKAGRCRGVILAWAVSLVASPAVAQAATTETKSSQEPAITSADVLARVEVLRDELDLIRRELGVAPPVHIDISVRDAEPRETYFHAYTLSDKAHRLALQFTGRPERALGILLSATTTPVDVYGVVSEALESIRTVNRALDITEVRDEGTYDPATTSSDVLRQIIHANRELNNLLYTEYSSLDTYQQVAESINFASRLLEQFPGSTSTPETTPFEPRKTPADVFHRLVDLFGAIREIALASSESALQVKVWPVDPTSITPSDAYDIARMVLSELAYFYSLLPDPRPVDEPMYPTHRILPSHVYQQLGVLETQLAQLTTLAKKHPDWLRTN